MLLEKVGSLDIPPGAKDFISYGDEWFEIECYSRNQVADNLRLLHDGGFIAGPGPSVSDFGIIGLTWQGAELLESIRNPEIWGRTKVALKKVGSVGWHVIATVAKAEAKRFAAEKLGIPL